MTNTLLRLLAIMLFVVQEVPCLAQRNFRVRASGPPGVLVQALAVDSAGTIVAGTDKAGIFRSTDRGDHGCP